MKLKDVLAWEKHLADQYVLLNNIIENMNLQRHGYKLEFYYSFNPMLHFMHSDGSDDAQEKLLLQLKDKGLLNYARCEPTLDTIDDSLSANTSQFPDREINYIKLIPESINEELPQLKKYEPSILLTRQDPTQSRKTQLSKDGYLYIAGQMRPIDFTTQDDRRRLLSLILANRNSRVHTWTHDELEYHLDPPASLEHPDMYVANTAGNINRKIAADTSPEVVRFLIIRNQRTNLNGRTINLNGDFL